MPLLNSSCTITTHGSYITAKAIQITTDTEDSQPLFAQLIAQIKQAVLTGQVRPGDPLPSIRQLAKDLDLNSKTVAKAYRLLERDSVVRSRGYRGTFVHADAIANSTVELTAWVTGKLNETITTFRASGVTDSEIRIAFGNAMNDRSKPGV